MQPNFTPLPYLFIAVFVLTGCAVPMKTYIKNNIAQPAGNSAFSAPAYTAINTEKNRKSLRGETPIADYFVEGRIIEQLKSGTQEDSGRAYTFYRTVERLNDEGYVFKEDDAIKKMWKKAGKEEMVFTAKKFCKFMREKWKKEGANIRQRDSILTANIYLLGGKRRFLGSRLRKARARLSELQTTKKQERKITLHLDALKKAGKTAEEAANRMKGLLSDNTATVTNLPNNEIGFEWLSNKTTSDIDGDGPNEYIIGNICGNSIAGYAEDIVEKFFKNIAERAKTNKRKPTIYLDINGRADGNAYHKKLGKKSLYSGEYGNPLVLNYQLEDVKAVSTFQSGRAAFKPATSNLEKGQSFFNKELALLRALCFEKNLQAGAQKHGLNLGKTTFFATEFSEKGPDFRGVRFSIRIAGLYEHNKEAIDSITRKMQGLTDSIKIVSTQIQTDSLERQDLAAKMRDLNDRRSETQVQRNIDETWQLADSKSVANVQTKDSTFHLIFFADTNDPNITASVNAVIVNLQTLMRSAADSIHYTFREYNYADSGFTIEQLQTLIKKGKFRTRSNDIVLFYFLGHGTNSSTNDFPHLLLANKAGETDYMNADGTIKKVANNAKKSNGVDLQEVYENLAKNKMKTLICVGEACNGGATIPSAAIKIPEMHTSDTLHTSTAQSLFSNYAGKWLISSSSKGQKSWAFENGGTVFFNILYNTMLEKAATAGAVSDSWEALLQKVQYNVSNETTRIGASYLQMPVFVKK
jgi:hypothetical protein